MLLPATEPKSHTPYHTYLTGPPLGWFEPRLFALSPPAWVHNIITGTFSTPSWNPISAHLTQ